MYTTTTAQSLQELLAQFLTYKQTLNHSQTTLKGLRNKLKAFLFWLNQNYYVTTADRLRKDHLHAYQNVLHHHSTRDGTPLKPGTINNRVTAIQAFISFLYRKGYLAVDISDQISHVKAPKFLPTSVLEHTQMRTLLNNVSPDSSVTYRNRTILELLYSTGIRNSELVGLALPDIHLDHTVCKVTGKGQKQRIVPIGKTAMRFLETYIKAIRPFWKNQSTTQILFLSSRGTPLQSRVLQRIIKQCSSDAPVHITAHTFRRSCTTELIRGNANLYHVKDFLGHASLNTLQPYTKLTINDIKKTHAKCHPREKDDRA